MIKGNHIGLFVICSLIYVSNLYGQQNIVQFEHINLEEGLSQGSVYCVLQDQKGFLWFGTQDGLNKYDGYQFTIYRHNKGDSSSLSDNCINAIQEDNEGYLWIGTLSGGLNRLDRRTNSFRSFQVRSNDEKSISSNTISCIFRDHSGKLWVGTDNGLNLMRGEDFTKFNYDPSNTSTINGNSITCIYEDSRKNLWFGTTQGLNRFDTVTRTFQRYSLFPGTVQAKEIHITALHEDRNKNLFVGTNGGGLFQGTVSRSSNPLIDFKQIMFPAIQRNEVSSLLSDPEGNVWIGYQEEGLIRWNPLSNEHIHVRTNPTQPNSLSNDLVSSLFFDK